MLKSHLQIDKGPLRLFYTTFMNQMLSQCYLVAKNENHRTCYNVGKFEMTIQSSFSVDNIDKSVKMKM
jgi:hypothetical protein